MFQFDDTIVMMTFQVWLHSDEIDKLVDFRSLWKPSEYIFLKHASVAKIYITKRLRMLPF